MKTVNYYGHDVDVPDNATHLATDRDGEIYAFYREPKLSGGVWLPRIKLGDDSQCHAVDYVRPGDIEYEDSLMEIK